MKDSKPKLVVITGPTASGKSRLAIHLALHFNGEIINADSMQVYRGMEIGTAKPTLQERKGIPHHMLDVVDPDEDFNAATYRRYAIPLFRDLEARGKVALLVGGTGLYIKTLIGGLLHCPPVDRGIRDTLQCHYELQGPQLMHARLRELDPDAAERIHPNDKIRVTRALEIIQLTGQRLSNLIQGHDFRDSPFHVLKIALDADREGLYRAIEKRSLLMIERGLVAETETLLQKGYSPELKSMKSLGYRHMVKYLEAACSLDEAIHQLQTDTRRYAKRQLTWFRGDPEMIWMSPIDFDKIVVKVEAFLHVELGDK